MASSIKINCCFIFLNVPLFFCLFFFTPRTTPLFRPLLVLLSFCCINRFHCINDAGKTNSTYVVGYNDDTNNKGSAIHTTLLPCANTTALEMFNGAKYTPHTFTHSQNNIQLWMTTANAGVKTHDHYCIQCNGGSCQLQV